MQGRSDQARLPLTVRFLKMLSWISYLLHPMGLSFPFPQENIPLHYFQCLGLVQIHSPRRH